MSEEIDIGEWFSATGQRIWKNIEEHFEAYEVNRKEILHKTSFFLIILTAFLIRLLPYLMGYQPLLKAFDPYFQLRSAEYILDHGLIAYLKWIDIASWYPYGRNVGQSMYIMIPLVAVIIYKVANFLGFAITLQFAAYLLPVIFGTIGVIYSYFLGKELISKRAGLFVALLMATSPAYLNRSIAGFFDNEALGVLFTIMALYYFTRAFSRDSTIDGFLAGLSLALLGSSWGAYRFTYDLLPLYLGVLIITGKLTYRHIKAYTITLGTSTLLMMMLPRVGGKLIFATEGAIPFLMLVASVIFLLFKYLGENMEEDAFRRILLYGVVTVVLLAAIIGGILYYFGIISKIGDKFVSVVIPTDRKNYPLIDSVSEHLPMSWGNLFFNIDSMVLFLLLSLYYMLKKPTEKNLFTLTYVLATVYFSGSMVRLVLLLAPAAALGSGLAIDNLLIPYALASFGKIKLTKTTMKLDTIGKEHTLWAYFIVAVLLLFNLYSGVMVAQTQLTSAEIAPGHQYDFYADWQETVQWLRANANYQTALANHEDPPVVLNWWDYGYWIEYGKAIPLADGSTINSTQIGLVGTMFMWNISMAIRLMYLYNVKYVLINSAGVNPDAGSDIGKAIWMIRISEKYTPEYGVKESDYYTEKDTPHYVDKFYDSLLYQLMTYRSSDMTQPNAPMLTDKDGKILAHRFIPDYQQHPADTALINLFFKEVFRSKGLIQGAPGDFPWVRIYEVQYPTNIQALAFEMQEYIQAQASSS